MNAFNPLTPQIVEGECFEPPVLSAAWFSGRPVPCKAALPPVGHGARLDWVATSRNA